MRKVSRFIKLNKLIVIFFVASIIIIVSYILTMNLPSLFMGAEQWFNLLFQLSIGYIINFMFYITQVYIPNNNRDLVVHQCISIRLNNIIKNMRSVFSVLEPNYIENHIGDEYTRNELRQFLKLRFSDTVRVLNARYTTRNDLVYFTVREWLSECISKTENEIDNLFKYYSSHISVDLMELLEDILNSDYHSTMKILLVAPKDVNFTQSCEDMFFSYYDLICRLEEVNEKDYKNFI